MCTRGVAYYMTRNFVTVKHDHYDTQTEGCGFERILKQRGAAEPRPNDISSPNKAHSQKLYSYNVHEGKLMPIRIDLRELRTCLPRDRLTELNERMKPIQ